MKIKILTILAFLPLLATAQIGKFTITGKIGGLNKPVKMHLDYTDGIDSHADSVLLVNGTFSFSGKINGIATARMSLDHTGEGKQAAIFKGNDNLYFYFAAEHLVIISIDSLMNASVKGSKFYDDYAAYNRAIGGSMMEINKVANARFNSGTPEQRKDTSFIKNIDTWFRKKIVLRNAAQVQYAKNHPHSFYAVIALSESAGVKLDVAKVEPIYDAIDAQWRQTSQGKDLASRIKAARTVVVGDPAPAFTLNDTNGKPVSIADFRGKIVLIDFWASWCEPCRAEGPNLKTQYELYKKKGFEILSVSIDTDKKSWLKAIADDKLTWSQVSDLKGYRSDVVKSYGLGGVPSFFLIGRDGKILANADLQGAGLNKRLSELFKN